MDNARLESIDVLEKIKQQEFDAAAIAAAFSDAVRNISEATSFYCEKISKITENIENVGDSRELKKIVSSVAVDTRAMMNQNRKLEIELCRSSLVMEKMRRDLDAIRREALTDELTGLSNRKVFDMEIRRCADETLEYGQSLTLMMIDVDHFKTFNDRYGHQIGDQVLRLVARTIAENIRHSDIACRYGGEEFAVLMPSAREQGGVVAAGNLCRAVAARSVIDRRSGQKMEKITVSIGVAELGPDEKIDDLIRRADAALYTAKNNGRNQVAPYIRQGSG